jgi:hypothetical protein
MIIREYFGERFDGVRLFKTYSNEGMKIHKVGTSEVYDEAIDIEGAPYIYEETDEPIEVAEQPQEENNA